METRKTAAAPRVTWKEEIWRQCAELEDWIDRVALRLGDALLGPRRSERLFGPHPATA